MNNEEFINAVERSARLASDYGVREDNPLWVSETQLSDIDNDRGPVTLDDPDLVKITRLRLLGDSDGWAYPYLDVSYCYGRLADGTHVRVDLGVYHFPKRGLKRALVELAQKHGRYAKGLGLLDDNVISRLH